MNGTGVLGVPQGDVTVAVGKKVSIAILTTPYGEFVGESKRAPGDQWSYQVGYNLALGRALQAYGSFLVEAADARSDFLCRH